MSGSDGGRTVTIVAYILHLLGAITGLLSVIGLIINYVVKGDHGEMIDSHQSWMIRSFWYAILGGLICGALFITVIGIPLAWLGLIVIWLWYIYRHIRGLIDLAEGKTMSGSSLL
ncbi:MAG TPA: DUF4870 domain-containing protein [Gammaproteobacteria bacterium]|jgi:uncharacterized membrane protein|nr:DUF4870 domain-containing protein [Gammaproteobacteria bacterium]